MGVEMMEEVGKDAERDELEKRMHALVLENENMPSVQELAIANKLLRKDFLIKDEDLKEEIGRIAQRLAYGERVPKEDPEDEDYEAVENMIENMEERRRRREEEEASGRKLP